MKFFCGSSNQPLGEKVAKKLGIALSAIDTHVFPDGEKRIRISESVVGENCFVIQSASTPVDTNYMELFFIVDALKRSGAEFVNAIVPYFGYQRQDHVFREGEAVSLEVVVKILENVGVDKVISFDMHTPKIPDLFHIPVAHLSALPVFAEEIKKQKWHTNESILVSPDMGGIARIKKISNLLEDIPYVSVEKNRDLTTGSLTSGGIVAGTVKGKKRAIMVDDMISSGRTMILASEEIKKNGIQEVIVFATHAIFSEGGPKRLQESSIDAVFVTDTVAIPKQKQFPKLHILSIAERIAQEITHPTQTNNTLLG